MSTGRKSFQSGGGGGGPLTPPSIGNFDGTEKADKTGRRTEKIGLDDNKSRGSADGRKSGGAAERKDALHDRTYNEELRVKDRENDLEEEKTDEWISGHGLGGTLPEATKVSTSNVKSDPIPYDDH